MRVIVGDLIIDWVKSRLPGPFVGELFGIGLVDERRIIAGAIFNNRKGHEISAHIAVDGQLTRPFLFACSHFAFEVCRVTRVSTHCRAANPKAIKVIEGFGFKYEGCQRRGWPDGDDKLLYGMLREDARWLNSRFAPKPEPTPTTPTPAPCEIPTEAV